MQPIMFCRTHYAQILEPVIPHILIYVVHIFMPIKTAPKVLLHHVAMFKNATSINVQFNVVKFFGLAHAST